MTIGRHTTYNIVGGLAPLIVSLVTVPLFLHLIGAERYGILALAWLMLGYFSIFDLGFGKATTQRIAALRDATARDRATTFWSALLVNFVTGVVGGVVLYIVGLFVLGDTVKVGGPLRLELIAALPILALSLPLATAGGVLSGGLRGRERFLELNAISTLIAVLSQLLPVATAWIVGPELRWLILASAVATLIGVILQAVVCRQRVTEGHPPKASRAEVLRLLRFGGWVTVSAVIGPLMIVLDRFVIGAVLGVLAVTVYTIPWQLAQRLLLLPLSLQGALYPRQAAADPAELARLTGSAIRAVIAVTTPLSVAAIFLVEPFLHLWLGGKLDVGAAAEVGRILILGFWSTGIAYIPFGRLEARGYVRVPALVHLGELPIYLLMLVVGLQWVGVVGAAVAFTLRCAADALVFTRIGLARDAPWFGIAFAAVLLLLGAGLADGLDAGTIGWSVSGLAVLAAALVQSWVIAPQLVRLLLPRQVFAR